jgi:hypothetical protein
MNAADISNCHGYCSVATCTVTLIMPTATGHCNDELPTATGHCNDEPSGSVTTVKKGLVPRVPFQFNAMQVHGRESSQTCFTTCLFSVAIWAYFFTIKRIGFAGLC